MYKVLSSPLRPVLQSVFGTPPSTIQRAISVVTGMFASGEQGAWYDPSDMSTLFQDSAGTVPVTAVEQPVGLILDKSGRGNHATQATTTKRPVLKIDAGGCYYLSFDGVDDALQTGNIDFTSTDKMTVWAGVTKLSDASMKVLLETSNIYANSGTFAIFAPASATSNIGFGANGPTTGGQGYYRLDGLSAPLTATLTAQFDLGVTNRYEQIAHRVDGNRLNATWVGPIPGVATGNFANHPLYIGARAGTSYFFNGRLYGLIVRGAQSSLLQIEATELYMKKKVGIA